PVDPSAASLAILAALTEPTLARRAAEYFDRQTRFVATQTEHMHEQREILVSSLRIRRINDGLRVVSQTLFVLAGLLVCVYFLVLFHDAITSRA
ncbi:hypothetical protein ACN9OL_12220, partial [Glaesserella parasuis]|uniref:hypothetical protein n=1 Tax=Glaesserella parasuis TaxID=738 RepID=UPI003B6702E7